jgi:hypothetical protein
MEVLSSRSGCWGRRLLEWLNKELAQSLGDANVLGAHSWLEALAWGATVAAAFYAAMSLHQQSLQSKATLLLALYERWEHLSKQRAVFAALNKSVRAKMLRQHADLQSRHQEKRLREAFLKALQEIPDDDKTKFQAFIAHLSFFETLGTYVKRGYIPLNDILLLYKGPILDVDIAFREYIEAWQKRAHVPPGLFANALSLMKRTRFKEEHPFWYALIPCKRCLW